MHHSTTYPGSSGTVTFENVPPREDKGGVYNLRVVGMTADGVRTVIRRPVRVGEKQTTLLIDLACNHVIHIVAADWTKLLHSTTFSVILLLLTSNCLYSFKFPTCMS